MTQPQVLQPPRQITDSQAMTAACNEVYDLAERFQRGRWDAVAVHSATLRLWADQLHVAAGRMQDLARFREGLGE